MPFVDRKGLFFVVSPLDVAVVLTVLICQRVALAFCVTVWGRMLGGKNANNVGIALRVPQKWRAPFAMKGEQLTRGSRTATCGIKTQNSWGK